MGRLQMKLKKTVLDLKSIEDLFKTCKSYDERMSKYTNNNECDLKVGDEIYYLDENNPIIINKYKHQLDDVMKNFDIFLKEFDDERN